MSVASLCMAHTSCCSSGFNVCGQVDGCGCSLRGLSGFAVVIMIAPVMEAVETFEAHSFQPSSLIQRTIQSILFFGICPTFSKVSGAEEVTVQAGATLKNVMWQCWLLQYDHVLNQAPWTGI